MNDSKQWARDEAKRLRNFLKTQGIELAHKQCLEAIAVTHGSRNWQSFEASKDADIVVNDANALVPLAEAALTSVLFERLPAGQSLASLLSQIRAANAIDSSEDWQGSKAAMNRVWEGVEEHNWCVPPAELPDRIDAARIALVKALRLAIEKKPEVPEKAVSELYRTGLADWRIGAGEDLPVTDARMYEARVSASTETVTLDCSYPHEDAESLPVGSAQLGIALEIDKGLPCVRLYSDIYAGEVLVSIYALAGGKLAVRVDADKISDRSTASHPVAKKLQLDDRSLIIES